MAQLNQTDVVRIGVPVKVGVRNKQAPSEQDPGPLKSNIGFYNRGSGHRSGPLKGLIGVYNRVLFKGFGV